MRGNTECSNGFFAGAEEDGGAETSEFGGDEAVTNPQDQTEVPRPLPCILYILFPNNGALPYEKHSLYFFPNYLLLQLQ